MGRMLLSLLLLLLLLVMSASSEQLLLLLEVSVEATKTGVVEAILGCTIAGQERGLVLVLLLLALVLLLFLITKAEQTLPFSGFA